MQDSTRITLLGRDPEAQRGFVNPPVYRGSTVLFPTVEAMERARAAGESTYGRSGTPTSRALADSIAELEGGYGCILTASGKAACNLTLAALLQAGDHLLMVDSVYGPTRRFCDRTLARFGVETTYYDPRIGAGIRALFRPETRLVFMESPGSLTFEVQDVPAIAAAARERGITTAIDATWGTPLFFRPLALGVDVSIQAVTKYIGGHSDLLMGAVTATEAVYPRLRAGLEEFGAPPSPEDCWLALRGLRTLAARLARHEESALAVARWLEGRPEVSRVLHPALESHPDHALWRRDFTGACGLFGVVLDGYPEAAARAMADALELFGIGASWGGFESLVLVPDPTPIRTAVSWKAEGALLRLHIGLEDPEDLIRDLGRGLARLRAAG
ncbi:MAG TPA: cystathionine beta-lyase [Rhodospirillales bacterium]|nr:cystathionine beta-lyase [Rhodospirillales bacterium]